MPTSSLLAAISILLVLDTLACAWIGWRGRQFLVVCPKLETDGDLEQYRRLIHHCMYGSLVFGVLLIASILTPVSLLAVGWIQPADVEAVLVAGAVRLSLAVAVTIGVENKLKAIPVASREFAGQRDALVRMWDRQVLPAAVLRPEDSFSVMIPEDKG